MTMQLQFNVDTSMENVYGCLTDPEQFISVHPLIYRMDPIEPPTYKVYEKTRLLFIPYSFTYNATVTGNEAEDEVRIEANISGMTHVVMRFQLSPDGGKTHVTEDIAITTKLPVKGFLSKLFREQHTRMFANISQRYAS